MRAIFMAIGDEDFGSGLQVKLRRNKRSNKSRQRNLRASNCAGGAATLQNNVSSLAYGGGAGGGYP